MIEVAHDFVPKIKKTGFYSRTYKILLTLGMVRNYVSVNSIHIATLIS